MSDLGGGMTCSQNLLLHINPSTIYIPQHHSYLKINTPFEYEKVIFIGHLNNQLS